MATHNKDDLDEFLNELDTAGVQVGEEDLQSEDWDELDSGEVPAGVRSLPDSTDSIRGSSNGGSPVGSRSSPTFEVGSKKASPAAAAAAASHMHVREREQKGPPEGAAAHPRPPAATVPQAAALTVGCGAKAPPPAAAAKPAAAKALAAAASGAAPTPAQAALAAARARVAAASAARSASAATKVVGTAPGGGTEGAAAPAAAVGSASAPTRPAGGPDVRRPPAATGSKPGPPLVVEQAEAAQAAYHPEAAPRPAAAPAKSAAAPMPAKRGEVQKQSGHQEEARSELEVEEGEERQAIGPGPASAGGSDGKRWAGWGAIGKLGATLQAAASTAVKDVSELTESFQQVLQEMAQAPSDEDEEGGAGGEAAGGRDGSAQPASRGPSQRLAQAASGSRAGLARQQEQGPGEGRQEDEWEEEDGGEGEELTPEQEARRRAVLEKLEGEDTKLEKSAKVIDAHVEQLSAGAGKALSSLWGWGATLAQKVEAAASTAAKELAETVNEASPAWSSAASGLADAGKPAEGLGRLGGRLGQLGRTARGLLEGGLQGAGRQSGGAAKDEAMSFDECFYVYGGHQAFEELETLSNECARLCNRVRSRLAEDDKANLDKVLALLVPLFDLSLELLADSGEGQGGSAPAEPAALARGHAMVADLAAAGCARADSMAHATSQKAAELVAPPSPSEELTATEGADEGAAATAAAAAAAGPTEGYALGQQGAAAVTQAVPQEQKPSLAAVGALQAIRSEGVKRIAEVGALCIERLLALARSMSAQFRYGRPADDGISWPAEPESKALLLRLQARKMLSDLEAVAESFVAALLGAGRGLNAHTDQKVYGKLSEALLPELDAAAASSRVRDAYKSLMYVVWLSGVDRELVE